MGDIVVGNGIGVVMEFFVVVFEEVEKVLVEIGMNVNGDEKMIDDVGIVVEIVEFVVFVL